MHGIWMRGEGGCCSSQSQLFVASNRLGGKKKEELSCFPLLLSLCECNSLQNSEKKHNEQLHLFFLQQSYLRANIPSWLSLQRLYMCVYMCIYQTSTTYFMLHLGFVMLLVLTQRCSGFRKVGWPTIAGKFIIGQHCSCGYNFVFQLCCLKL